MSADLPKPLDRQMPAPRANENGGASPKDDESDLLEYPPEGSVIGEFVAYEEPEEPKGKLADLIEKTLEENGSASAMSGDGEPTATISLTQPAISPDYLEKAGHVSQPYFLDRLQQIAWTISGVIRKHRFIKKDLLAVMLVSKEQKASALDTPSGNLDIEPSPKPNVALEAYENIRELRDGLYLVLKLDGAKVFVLGGERAETVAPETVESGYQEITSVRKFFKRSDKIEKGSAENTDTDAKDDDE